MSRKVPETIRLILAKRAGYCCEYCKIPMSASFYSFQADHIISWKHGGITELINLAWACFPCNNIKGTDIGTMLLPDRTFVRLFNPREELWDEHFEMEQGVIYAKTKIGEATIKVLKLNEVDRIIERQAIYD